MNLPKLLLFSILAGGFFISCSQDQDDFIDDDVTGNPQNLEVENFIYNGMNNIYLYKSDILELEDHYFANQSELDDYLIEFDSPEDLFHNGLKSSQDAFSFMTDDYVALEQSFQGTSTTTGMNYGLAYYPNNSSKILGYVRYVSPNTSASDEGIERGTIFNKVDGQQLTPGNYGKLLAPPSITIHLAELDDEGNVTDTDETLALTKTEYTENPVHTVKTLEVDDKKIGYLLYNSFTADFDDDLNAAFADFKADDIDELVLDLRYNGGGNVETAVDLASMITGQFEGDIFSQQEWNDTYQEFFENDDPENLYDRFNDEIRTGEKINSLNLDKVYVIATGSSASASELLINGLDAYIDVVHIGTNTVGKFQASVTLYDSPDFLKKNANPDHKYAIQPLVYKSANAHGNSDYFDGLSPDVKVEEYPSAYAPLGDIDEPLLSAALNHIAGNKMTISNTGIIFGKIGESGEDQINYQKMYVDELPAEIKKKAAELKK